MKITNKWIAKGIRIFKNLRILTVPSQYILSLMKFLVNNLECFTFNSIIHTKFTRNMCHRQICHCVKQVFIT
jgi:hypothetical protein